MEIKRFIDVHVPISACNFRCHYCYVGQTNSVNSEVCNFEYTPDVVKKALTIERLGGDAILIFAELVKHSFQKNLKNMLK